MRFSPSDRFIDFNPETVRYLRVTHSPTTKLCRTGFPHINIHVTRRSCTSVGVPIEKYRTVANGLNKTQRIRLTTVCINARLGPGRDLYNCGFFRFNKTQNNKFFSTGRQTAECRSGLPSVLRRVKISTRKNC